MSLNFTNKILIGGESTPTLQFYNRGFNLGGSASVDWREVTLSGVGALTLTNALANSLLSLKLFGATEQSNLPNGYTQVEYLQSSGEEYIDLGGTLSTSTDDIEVTLQLTTTSNTMSFVGARTSTTDKNYNIGAYGTSSLWRWGWKGNADAVPDVAIDTNKHTFYIDHTNQTLSVDGVVAETRVISGNITTPTTPILFGIHATSATILYLSPVRIYGFKKWRSGELAQHLVPCRRKSDNELGMYDFVTGTFFTNQGTGTFTAGDDVTPTPTAPINIKCNNGVLKLSANILNRNELEGGYLLTDEGQRGSSNNNWILTNFIKVKPNTSYIFDFISGGDSVYRRVCGYSTNNYNSFTELLVKKQRPVTEGLRFSEPFTTSATTNYIKVSTYKADTNIQITEGTEVIPYRAYGEVYANDTIETVTDSLSNTATAEMLLAIDNFKDTQSVLDGTVTRNIGIKVFDGTESWSRTDARVALVLGDNSADENFEPFCTHYLGCKASLSLGSLPDNGCKFSNATNTPILIKDSVHNTDINTWKAYLADQYANGTPVILVYPLATSTTETVTGQTLTTKAGTNTITATGYLDNLGLEVSYKGT